MFGKTIFSYLWDAYTMNLFSKKTSILVISIITIVFSPSHSHTQVANIPENRDYKVAAGLYAEGMYEMALKELERFIENYPSSSNVIYARFLSAGSHFYLKNFSKAIEITSRIRKENPSAQIIDKVLFLEGRVLFQLGQYKEAVSILERMIENYSSSDNIPEALFNIGDAYYNMNNYNQAAEN